MKVENVFSEKNLFLRNKCIRWENSWIHNRRTGWW